MSISLVWNVVGTETQTPLNYCTVSEYTCRTVRPDVFMTGMKAKSRLLHVCIFWIVACADWKSVVKTWWEQSQEKSPTDLLEQADDVLADLGQTEDYIIGVDVTQGGVVTALTSGLVQHQVPAVHRGQQVLVFPGKNKYLVIITTLIEFPEVWMLYRVKCLCSWPHILHHTKLYFHNITRL